MTRSNVWALIIGLFLVGGTVIGGVAWRQNHPDAPEQLSRLVAPLVPNALKSAAPDSKQAGSKQAGSKQAETKPAEIKPAEIKPSEPAQRAQQSEAPKPEARETRPPEATPVAPKETKQGEGPEFDVVRVEPSGDAVFAGRGDPDAKVALVERGKVVSETKADPSGHFVMLPPALKPGDHDLSLQQSEGAKPAVDSKQNVAISIPRTPSGQVVIALAEPGKPTKLLSSPPKAPAPALANAPPKPAGAHVATARPETAVIPPAAVAPKGPDLAIRTVELESGNGFFATGVGTPGTKIEVYLNGAHLAEVTAGPDGRWSVTIRKGLTGGHYAVRADALGADRKVAARVEVPFDVPVAMGEPVKPPPGPAKVPPGPAKVAAAPARMATPPAKVAAAPAKSVGASGMRTGPNPDAPAPYSAPSPSEVAGLGGTLAGPGPQGDIQPVVPAPRSDIAAAAKATTQAVRGKAPPTLAMAPPARTTGPDAVPAPTPPAGATAPQTAPARMAVAPAKPAGAPPVIASTKPAIAPPKRAEVAVAVGAKPAPADTAEPFTAREPSSTDAANAVIQEVETALVVPGDNLWNISRAKLGHGTRYTQIYAANVSQIRNPNLIYPGQVFVMPQ